MFAVNSTATLPLTLTSSGTAPLTINAATLSGTGFTDSGATFPVTLNPNQSVTLQVKFNPNSGGAACRAVDDQQQLIEGATTSCPTERHGHHSGSPAIAI